MGGGGSTKKGAELAISVNTGGRAKVMLIQTLDTGRGVGGRGSQRWRYNFDLFGGCAHLRRRK